jgi:hypothetical protein
MDAKSMSKVCSSCKKNLPLTTDFFYWRKDTKRKNSCGYFNSICKECEIARVKKHKSQQWIKGQSHHTENALLKRRLSRLNKKYKLNLQVEQLKIIEELKKYFSKYKLRINDIKKNKSRNIAGKLRKDLKNNVNNFYPNLGYTTKNLKCHLEKYFSKGMTWEKFHSGEIHIDHIIPKSRFNLQDEKDIKTCWSLENLQPLWAKDNIRKSNKIIYNKQAMEINPILAITWHLHKWRLVPQLLDEALQGLSDTHNQS